MPDHLNGARDVPLWTGQEGRGFSDDKGVTCTHWRSLLMQCDKVLRIYGKRISQGNSWKYVFQHVGRLC
jgi:hypothetical protein